MTLTYKPKCWQEKLGNNRENSKKYTIPNLKYTISDCLIEFFPIIIMYKNKIK